MKERKTKEKKKLDPKEVTELTEEEMEKAQGGRGAAGPLITPGSFAGPGICHLPPPPGAVRPCPVQDGGKKHIDA